MNHQSPIPHRLRPPSKQGGVVLFIALIAVVLLLLAGLATLRSVDTTTLLTGNLAFREAAVQSSDFGIEQARLWLMQRPSADVLFADDTNNGYFSTWDDQFDPRNYDWAPLLSTKSFLLPASTFPGYEIRYVIHRMCQNTGSFLNVAPAANCIMATAVSNEGDSKKVIGYGEFNKYGEGTGQPYYRVTTRVIGPRNSASYIQAIIY